MKLAFFLMASVLLLAGCVKSTDYAGKNTTVQNYTPAQDVTINISSPNSNAGQPPLIRTTTASPSNPDRQEPFNLTVGFEDDFGIVNISWESLDAFSMQPESHSFNCGLQKECSVSWQFSSSQDGLKTITVFAMDSEGQESTKTPIQINVQQFDFMPPSSPVCGNNVCENGETNTTCQSDCRPVGPVCGDNVCNEKEAFEICPGDCPYREFACANAICEGGESYQSCPQDCSLRNIIGTACGDGACEPGEDASYCPADCTTIKPNCGNNICDSWETQTSCRADCEGASSGDEESCSSNAACGYKQICTSGKCVSVDCTNDGQCGYGKECEGNRCVRCPSGPYGPAC